MGRSLEKFAISLINKFEGFENAVDILMNLKRVLWEISLSDDNLNINKDKSGNNYRIIHKKYIFDRYPEHQNDFEYIFASLPGVIKINEKIVFQNLSKESLRFSPELFRPFAFIRNIVGGIKSDADLRFFVMRNLRKYYQISISPTAIHLFHLLSNAVNSIYELGNKSKRTDNWHFKNEFTPFLKNILENDTTSKQFDNEKFVKLFCECSREIGYLRPHHDKSGYIQLRTNTFDSTYLTSNLFGMPTSIKGFDDLLGGGGLMLIDNSVARAGDSLGGRTVLIKGRFGTGKSLLSLQLAAEVAKKGGVAWVMPLEQSAEECLYTLESFNGLPNDNSVIIASNSIELSRVLDERHPGKGIIIILRSIKDSFDDFLEILIENEQKIERFPLRLICIDPINSIQREKRDSIELRAQMLETIKKLEDNGANILLVAEENEDSKDELAFEQNIADTVIRLSVQKKYGYASRIFELMKSRFQREQRGEHPFSIISGLGINIYPASAAVNTRIIGRRIKEEHDKVEFGLQSFDDILGDGAISTGDVIVFQGTKGAFKTYLGLKFLLGESWRGVDLKSLFIDAKDDEIETKRLLNQFPRIRTQKKARRDIIFCNLPKGHIYPGYIIQRIEEEFLSPRLGGKWIDRVMIDNISHWEMTSPFIREDMTFGDTLIDILRRQQVTSLIVCNELDNSLNSVIQRSIIDSADCIVQFDAFDFRGSRTVMIKVVKTRNMNHHKGTFELVLNDSGVNIKSTSSLLRFSKDGEVSPIKIRLFLHTKNNIHRNYNDRIVENLRSLISERIEIDFQERIYNSAARGLSQTSVVDELQILQIDEYQLPQIKNFKNQNLLYKYSEKQLEKEHWDSILPKLKSRVKDEKDNFFAVPYYINIGLFAFCDNNLTNHISTWSDLAAEAVEWEKRNPSLDQVFFDFPKHISENFNCLFFEILLSEFQNDNQSCLSCLLKGENPINACKIMRTLTHRAYLKERSELQKKPTTDPSDSFRHFSKDAQIWRHWYTTLNEMLSAFEPSELEKIHVQHLPQMKSVLGNWYLGVTSYSASSEVGLEIIKFFTNRESENERLQLGVGLPTRSDFYDDGLINSNASSSMVSPYFQIDVKILKDLIDNSFNRSNIEGYMELSGTLSYYLCKIIEIPHSSDKIITNKIENLINSLQKRIKFIRPESNCRMCKSL